MKCLMLDGPHKFEVVNSPIPLSGIDFPEPDDRNPLDMTGNLAEDLKGHGPLFAHYRLVKVIDPDLAVYRFIAAHTHLSFPRGIDSEE